MKIDDSLKQRPTSKKIAPATGSPFGAKVVRKHYNLYPVHIGYEEQLCGDYRLTASKLHMRLLEQEIAFHYLAAYRDSVLQRPLFTPGPGVDRSHESP